MAMRLRNLILTQINKEQSNHFLPLRSCTTGISKIHKKLERTPRSYAYVAYDILWIASLTQDSIKKMKSPQSDSADSFKQKFREIASTYKGITGNTTLNKVGDRRFGDYDLWAIRATNKDDFAWRRVGKYVNGI
jgi:ABC-type branched-subunit amino acid transport system substrate-binding protein